MFNTIASFVLRFSAALSQFKRPVCSFHIPAYAAGLYERSISSIFRSLEIKTTSIVNLIPNV